MHSPFVNLDFEQFVYRQGQLLASRDFRDQARMEAARRWMHNSAIHNAWGVAAGYEYSLFEDKLKIAPGIAYDCFGRELILASEVEFHRSLFVDDRNRIREEWLRKTVFLVLAYQDCPPGPREQDCLGSPGHMAFPPPALLWKEKHEVRFGEHVPILFLTFPETRTGHVEIQAYGANRARPQARPKIASGQPLLLSLNIRQLSAQPVTGQTVSVGFEIDVDTGDAGFQVTPCYFAWLTGIPLLLFISPFSSVTNERPDGFTFQILVAQRQSQTFNVMALAQPQMLTMASLLSTARTSASPTLQELSRQVPKLCWIGIEGQRS